jgi:hypothetical protein
MIFGEVDTVLEFSSTSCWSFDMDTVWLRTICSLVTCWLDDGGI